MTQQERLDEINRLRGSSGGVKKAPLVPKTAPAPAIKRTPTFGATLRGAATGAAAVMGGAALKKMRQVIPTIRQRIKRMTERIYHY